MRGLLVVCSLLVALSLQLPMTKRDVVLMERDLGYFWDIITKFYELGKGFSVLQTSAAIIL